jgi:hypothetical protein
MNLGPPSSCFFFNSGPKKALSLSLDVKFDQQTHKKNDASNYGINLKKIILQSSHENFQMLLAGDEPIIIELFFHGFEGVMMGLIMGSQNIMGSDYGSNISAANNSFKHDFKCYKC